MVSYASAILCTVLVVCLLESVLAAKKVKVTKTGDWNYDNPAWEKVSDKYGTCGNGTRQSPFNVESCHAQSHCDRPSISLKMAKLQHSAKVNNFAMECKNDKDKPCSEIEYKGKQYKMLQLHAHSPSEYVLNGQSYPLEIHFVHASEAKELAVLGVFFKLGKHNPDIEKILGAAKKNAAASVDLGNFFHEHGMLCSFQGSLTTPPCSEGVSWFISWAVHEISADQMFMYRKMVGGIKNNRPLQNRNGRDVACVH